MQKYNKLWAAIAGLFVIAGLRYFDIEIAGIDRFYLEILANAATAAGVYQAPNQA